MTSTRAFKRTFDKVFTPAIGKSSAFSFADIPSLAIWHDASDTGTITGGVPANSVLGINDKKGGSNLTQLTEANQPSTGLATVNGLNVISTDGTAEWLANASIPMTANATFMHVVYVQLNNNAFDSVYAMNGTNSFQIDSNSIANSFFGQLRTTGLGGTSPPISGVDLLGAPVLLTYVFNGATVDMYVDGVLVDSDTYNGGLGATQVYYLGVNRGLNQFPQMLFCEGAIFSAGLAGAELTNAHDYMISKWGL